MFLSDSAPCRRCAIRLITGALAAPLLTGCGEDLEWSGVDVSGALPDLAFTMTRAGDGETVSEADFRGQITALFFGFTFCPDICPMTLANLTAVADALGKDAEDFSILFVTVDPMRDTPRILTEYVANFSPHATGLRGTDNQLASLARRYRVTYRVDPANDYTVSHGPSVYLFDRAGAARILLPDFDTANADIEGVTSDVRQLLGA